MVNVLSDSEQVGQVQGDNLNLIYSYTESFLNTRTAAIARLETRLTTALAFGGVCLKLVYDLPTHSRPGQLLQFAAMAILIATLGVIGFALRSQRAAGYPNPKELSDDWYFAPEADLRGFMVSQLIVVNDHLETIGQGKARGLNLAILGLTLSGICYGLAAAFTLG